MTRTIGIIHIPALQADKPRLPHGDDGLMKFCAMRNVLLLQIVPEQEKQITEFMTFYDID